MESEETPGLPTKLPINHVGLTGLVITCLVLFSQSLGMVSVQSPKILP